MADRSDDFKERVREAGDIVRLVADYVPSLKQAGSRYKGLCPFHEEKTPSFTVNPDLQAYYCFGCQQGGDVFRFVEQVENLGFRDALHMLAERWGVPIPDRAGRDPRQVDATERIRAALDAAQSFFRERLTEPEGGATCRRYLDSRGFGDETIEGLGMGWAPDGWEALRSHLLAKRFTADELLAAGLVLPRKSGQGQYDRFRARLIFPIRDVNGRPLAFGGRTIGDDQPKYINSPETPVYTKGEHLYGLDRARETIRREGLAIVVEGYLDAAALVQAGFHNVVATLGTAFSEAQARLLSRFTRRVVFSYDGDTAGASATARSLDLLLSKGFEVRVVELPSGCDPDDFIRREGAEAYGQRLRQAPGYLQFLMDRELGQRDLSQIAEQVAMVNAVLPHIARLDSGVERSQWCARLADAAGVDSETVLQELRQAARAAAPEIRSRAGDPRHAGPDAPREIPVPRAAEARLVHRLIGSEAERRSCLELYRADDLEGSAVRGIVHAIVDMVREDRPVDYTAVLGLLDDEVERELLTRIAFSDEPDEGPDVSVCLEALRRRSLERETRRAGRELRSGSGRDMSPADLDAQLRRIQELARQRDALS